MQSCLIQRIHGTLPTNSDWLIETVARFFSLLCERQIDYVLVGNIALLQYVEGRNTEDIELIMAVSALERLPELQLETRDADSWIRPNVEPNPYQSPLHGGNEIPRRKRFRLPGRRNEVPPFASPGAQIHIDGGAYAGLL